MNISLLSEKPQWTERAKFAIYTLHTFNIYLFVSYVIFTAKRKERAWSGSSSKLPFLFSCRPVPDHPLQMGGSAWSPDRRDRLRRSTASRRAARPWGPRLVARRYARSGAQVRSNRRRRTHGPPDHARPDGYETVLRVSHRIVNKVYFEIYIADRKATTCI